MEWWTVLLSYQIRWPESPSGALSLRPPPGLDGPRAGRSQQLAPLLCCEASVFLSVKWDRGRSVPRAAWGWETLAPDLWSPQRPWGDSLGIQSRKLSYRQLPGTLVPAVRATGALFNYHVCLSTLIQTPSNGVTMRHVRDEKTRPPDSDRCQEGGLQLLGDSGAVCAEGPGRAWAGLSWAGR